MKKMIKISVIFIIIFIFIGIFLLLNKKELISKPTENNVATNNIITNIKKPVDTSTWTDYKNDQLGFLMKIPLEVPTLHKCSSDNQTKNTPIKIYEDNQNGVVYISAEYYYDVFWNQAEQKYIGNCDKINYSLELLKIEEATKYLSGLASHPFIGWKIIIKNIGNDDDILKYIKENFGSTCTIVSKNLQENGNYQIDIKGISLVENGQGIMDETCLTNFVYKILYSPEKHKLMSVVLGQECTFGTDPSIPSAYQCYDDEMINSFKFE
jgi:hypothetical protein